MAEFNFKTSEEKALEYEAAITGILTGGISSYSLPTGLSVTKQNIEVLERLYEHYKKLAYREATSGGIVKTQMDMSW
jgi:hypothetical protein